MGHILGLDISMRATGVAVMDEQYHLLFTGVVGESEHLDPDPELDCIKRVRVQADLIIPLVRRFEPDVIVIEGPAYNALVPIKTKGATKFVLPKRVCQLWQLTGALKYALMQVYGDNIVIIAPTALKKGLTGSGKAEKADMVRVVKERFGPKYTDHNICDAIGLCVVHLDNMGKRRPKRK